MSGCPALCYLTVVSTSFLCIPALSSSILFLQISLKTLSLICPPRLILKHCRGETGTISQQSTNSRVHLGTRSDLVSTFCCSRADINHPAAHSGTCCTLLHLASPRPPRLFPLPWVGFAYSGHFLFFFIQISCHHYNSPRTSSHDCSFYQPHPDPPDVNVSLAASLENCLKMVRSSFFQPSLK